jgi:hypothetical protein
VRARDDRGRSTAPHPTSPRRGRRGEGPLLWGPAPPPTVRGRGRLGGGACPSPIAAIAVAFIALSACGSRAVKPTVVQAVLPEAKPEARQFFEEGLRLLHRNGPLEAAAEQFTKAVRADQKLFEAWHDLGVIRARQGQWDEAGDALRAALAL